MKKQTVMSMLLFQALLIAQINCKATIDMGTDAINIDVGVDEDDDDYTDDSNTTSNNSYEMDAASFNNSETYSNSSKADASDLFPMGNQSSTPGSEYVATLDLGNDRLGVNYRPKGYGLGANKVKKVIGDNAFSMELNRKAANSAPESAEDVDVETKGYPNSNETIAERADIGINEKPILVNMEYYQFPLDNSGEEDMDLDQMLAQPTGSNHGHTAKPYTDQSSKRYKSSKHNWARSRSGVSFVPVLYQKKNYSNEIVYEPVYPNPRGYYVPTVYPQYVSRMKNARSKPVNYVHDE